MKIQKVRYWFLLQLLAGLCSAELKVQRNVPAIMFSYKMVPGVQRRQEQYDLAVSLPCESFMSVAKEFISGCNSEVFVLVNQPGLRRTDFIENESAFASLKRYIGQSSSAVKFEKVEVLPTNTFDELVEYTRQKCMVEKVVNIRGNVTEDYEPYLDTEKRLIKIDYPNLPEDKGERYKALEDYDKFLRSVLAQIPSPQQTVIYTSLQPGKVNTREDILPLEIFPEVFQSKKNGGDVEINERVLQVPPISHTYRPKFPGISSHYISVFDSDFLEQNRDLLKAIGTAMLGYLILQLVNSIMKKREATAEEKRAKPKSE